MKNRIFVDLHVIQTVPPSCVNRDDTGSPKTAMYGGVRRARVSSQSWKKAIRDQFKEEFDESELGIRTLNAVDVIADKIRSIDTALSKEEAVGKAAGVLRVAGIKLDTKKKKDTESEENLRTGALFFISSKQAENMAALALTENYSKKDAQEALNKGNGVDIALFGRMVADDPSLNSDASAQVAHAISTHKVDTEYDYFTAIDDRSPADNAGAGMIGTVEFNSSTLYRYATVSVHDLYNRLECNKEMTSKAITEFIKAFMLSMPTGKQNTFANRTVPNAAIIAIRDDQPINLVSAFESPVGTNKSSIGYLDESIDRLIKEKEEATSSFVKKSKKTWQIGKGLDALGPSADVETTISEIEDYLNGELGEW
ncbi:MAG: type I-E CRISPR-associated protein Cas7/Cse4/CasC [Candidatus Methanomethylophilaceae archaeon]